MHALLCFVFSSNTLSVVLACTCIINQIKLKKTQQQKHFKWKNKCTATHPKTIRGTKRKCNFLRSRLLSVASLKPNGGGGGCMWCYTSLKVTKVALAFRLPNNSISKSPNDFSYICHTHDPKIPLSGGNICSTVLSKCYNSAHTEGYLYFQCLQ